MPRIGGGKVSGPGGAVSGPAPIQFLIPGAATVAANIVPPGVRVAQDMTVGTMVVRAGTAPTGAPLTHVLRRNGATWQTLSLPAGSAANTVTGLATPLTAGDIITVDRTSIGSTVAGSDVAIDVIPTTAPAEAFLNTTVTGLLMRYRASRLTAADGAPVTAWPDLSGNGRLLAPPSGKAPVFVASAVNGKGAVRFNSTAGGAKAMTGALTPAVVQPLTVVVVAAAADVNAQSNLHGGAGAADATTYLKFNKLAMGAGGTAQFTDPAIVGGTWYGHFAVYNGATSVHEVQPLDTAGRTNNPGTGGLTGITVGNDYTTNGTTGNVDIAEILVYDHALTQTERNQIRAYITTEYGI